MLFLAFLFFCIEIGIYSSSHSIYYCSIALLITLLSLICYRSFWYFFLIIIAFVWALVSVYVYDNSLSHDFHKNDAIVLSGKVIAYGKSDQLVFEDYRWFKRLVKTKQQALLWEEYIVQGKISVASSSDGNALWLFWEFDYEKRLWMKWFAWVLSTARMINMENTHSSDYHLWSLKNKLYASLQSRYNSIHAGLVEWMLWWGRYHMDENLYDSFIHSGFVHILSVSGGNISLILIFLSFLLFFIPYYFRLCLLSFFVILYTLFCGLDSSVVRAMCMSLFMFLALWFWRKSDSLRALALCCIFMLCINPYALLYDLWFSLSFMAVLGMLLVLRYWHSYTKIYEISWLLRMVTWYSLPGLWASLGVLPLLLLQNGSFNLMSIFWNYIIQLLIAPIMIISWFSLLLSEGRISSICVDVVVYLLDLLILVSNTTNDQSYFLLAQWSYALLLVFIILVYIFYILYSSKASKK